MGIRFLDWFAGIGGFRLGLERANKEEKLVHTRSDIEGEEVAVYGNAPTTQGGDDSSDRSDNPIFRCVGACEIDKYCRWVYAKNFGHQPEWADSRAVDPAGLPDHDLFCAGFPCQAFSVAGKRRGFRDPRGTLFYEIARIVRVKRPRYLLLENVKGLLSVDKGFTFEEILRQLEGLGYVGEWMVLNSKNHGVPQNRERVFIVGHPGGESRPKVFPVKETTGENNLECIGIMKEGYESMPTFDGYNYLPRHRIYNPKGIGRALAVHEDQMPFIKTEQNIRRLTPTECERLQGFPDGWTEGVSDTQRYRMLGNAVTVNVIEAIGRELLKWTR